MRDADMMVQVSAGADQAALRRARLGVVLRSLRDHGPRSRARLAAELGITRSAASSLVDELEERGLVRSGALERGGVGRPGTAVQLQSGSVAGIGAEVNVDHLATMAVDLSGEVISETRRGLDARRVSPAEVLDELAAMLQGTLADVAFHGASAVAITVGAAGLVDAARGLVAFAPNLLWHDVPVAGELRRRLGHDALPVRLDNEANLAAVAEIDPTDPDRDDMLVLYGEIGMGGGVVADGRLLRGRHGWAGEFGHIVVDPQGRRCRCGRVGCWETVIGLQALLNAATDSDDPVRDPSITLEERLDQLAERARRGDDRTLAALHQIGGWLGTGAAVLVNALNPGAVVLSGYFAAVGEWFVPAVERQLDAAVIAPRAGGTRVVVSALGPTAAVRGGALMSLESVFTDPTGLPRLAGAPNGGIR